MNKLSARALTNCKLYQHLAPIYLSTSLHLYASNIFSLSCSCQLTMTASRSLRSNSIPLIKRLNVTPQKYVDFLQTQFAVFFTLIIFNSYCIPSLSFFSSQLTMTASRSLQSNSIPLIKRLNVTPQKYVDFLQTQFAVFFSQSHFHLLARYRTLH